MTSSLPFPSLAKGCPSTGPLTALAPMQDVTDLPFWKLMAHYGGPDLYYTEYFRVHATSRLEPWILDSLIHNPTGRPAIAQMIGNDIPSLVRSALELQQHPIAAVDLNLGCPAPVVYRKCAGGGLLREPERIDAILGALRDAVQVRFTVKTRLGFKTSDEWPRLMEVFSRHKIDLLTVHGRTVAGGYQSEVEYDRIADAARQLPFPVLANGNVDSARKALDVTQRTGVCGVMIGRSAIRNPWIFGQVRAVSAGESPRYPTGLDVLDYVERLYEYTQPGDIEENNMVQKMKRYLNFLAIGVEPTGQFLHEVRRVSTRSELFEVCKRYMNHTEPLTLEPFKIPMSRRDIMASNRQDG